MLLTLIQSPSIARHGKTVIAVELKNDLPGGREFVTVSGSTEGEDRTIHIGYNNELQEVNDVSVTFSDSRGKGKKVRRSEIVPTSAPDGGFYHSYAAWGFTIPAHCSYQYSFTRRTKALMLFSGILDHSECFADSVLLTINVSSAFTFHYDAGDTMALSHIAVDSSRSISGTSYSFLQVLGHAKLRPLRVIVTRAGVDPWASFHDWYLKLSGSQTMCGEQVTDMARSLAANSINTDTITYAIFDYVRKGIKYVDVENGLGAFQPRTPEKVFNEKQGDCKDKANLLCQMLRSQGLEAYLAIASTSDHHHDLTFPSVASANHVICVVKGPSGWQYLDATIPYGTPGKAGVHMEGRHIFIIGHGSNGSLHLIPRSAPAENCLEVKQTLTQTSDGYKGSLYLRANGHAAEKFLAEHFYFPKEHLKATLMKFFTGNVHCSSVENIEIVSTDHVFSMVAQITYPPNVLSSINDLVLIDFFALLPVFTTSLLVQPEIPGYAMNVQCETSILMRGPASFKSADVQVSGKGYEGCFASKSDQKNQLYLSGTLVITPAEMEKGANFKTIADKSTRSINQEMYEN